MQADIQSARRKIETDGFSRLPGEFLLGGGWIFPLENLQRRNATRSHYFADQIDQRPAQGVERRLDLGGGSARLKLIEQGIVRIAARVADAVRFLAQTGCRLIGTGIARNGRNAGAGSPHNSASVGYRSINSAGAAVLCPAVFMPGTEMMSGTRAAFSTPRR